LIGGFRGIETTLTGVNKMTEYKNEIVEKIEDNLKDMISTNWVNAFDKEGRVMDTRHFKPNAYGLIHEEPAPYVWEMERKLRETVEDMYELEQTLNNLKDLVSHLLKEQYGEK
tara:strand:+ start:543 stop:881 length:339 start_codon:yes stop_codon:yes gene_type:complete